MRIDYLCRHCHHSIGSLDRPNWNYLDAEQRLGLAALSPKERLETVSYASDGMQVHTVCHHCQQALEANPELLLEGKLLQ